MINKINNWLRKKDFNNFQVVFICLEWLILGLVCGYYLWGTR